MSNQTRISAHVSTVTKARLESLVRATGMTRAHLIEQALLHHLSALEELPLEASVPTRLVLDRESAQRVRELMERHPATTDDLKQLFDDG